MTDHVDGILAQWAAERPDLDVSPMAVLGRLARTSRLADASLGATFARHGLDAASFDVLATLRRSGTPFRLTPTEIGLSAMVTSSAIAQRLNRLEREGLVRRSPNAADGRGTDVSLTPEGLAVIDRALPDHVATEQRMLAGLNEEQRSALATLLQALADSLTRSADESV
ncbi:MarR family winged helix-turn-helix transcriptional regulator [Cryobacterium fucosi]|uniref:MarR family transcriptional regulator n=1 Tax=Cryobacterium fucosi TaxID=1259157 RepID=A0A4R9B8Y6_9MICO|nr:MarR family transcriptional regulator [Cryobacterium fucosi]TFD78280.1 MarR family transcriptional regulator [Cryobacterium fucosi]